MRVRPAGGSQRSVQCFGLAPGPGVTTTFSDTLATGAWWLGLAVPVLDTLPQAAAVSTQSVASRRYRTPGRGGHEEIFMHM